VKMKENGILTRGGSALRWVAALAICALFLLPILWVLSISLKPPDEWLAYPPRLVPAQTTLNNYVLLFRKGNPVGGISEMVSSAEPVTPAFLNSLLIVPIATELPEKVNSILWIRKRKDTLAFGNITGAMVFQGSLLPALGILLTPWEPRREVMAGLVLTIVASAYLLFMLRRGNLRPVHLFFNGFCYLAYLITVLV